MTESTGRDEVWSLALRVARSRRDRGYLEELTPETVISAARIEGIETSGRTVRRVLAAMSETGILELVEDDPIRYRLVDDLAGRCDASTDVSTGRSSGSLTDMSDDADDLDEDDASTNLSTVPRESPISRYADLGDDDVGISDDDILIYHLFADTGVEAEPLSAYGTVVRVGIDPQQTRFGDVIRADARDPPFSRKADLGVLHPPCQRWSTLTHLNGDPEDHPNWLPEARDVADRLCDDYILENVPEAPLEDPVTLTGRMFGLPIHYRRAFETSFSVPQPVEQADLVDDSGPFASEDGGVGDWRGSALIWRSAKQVSGEYPAEDLKHSGIPAPYIHYLMRYWLRSRPELASAAIEAEIDRERGEL